MGGQIGYLQVGALGVLEHLFGANKVGVILDEYIQVCVCGGGAEVFLMARMHAEGKVATAG